MTTSRAGALVKGVVTERTGTRSFIVLTEAWDLVPCSVDDALIVAPDIGDRVAIHVTRGAFRCGVILVALPPALAPVATGARRRRQW